MIPWKERRAKLLESEERLKMVVMLVAEPLPAQRPALLLEP